MMRLSCLSLSFQPEFADKRMDDLKFIELCADLGLDGVDFNMRSFASLEPDHLKKIKKTCLQRGLTIACIGVSNDFGRPADEQEAVFAQVRRGIDTARSLGAPVVRLFAGWVRAGRTEAEVWQRCVTGLRRAAEYGKKMGVPVALQNHNHGNVTRTGADVVRLLKEVAHPWCLHMLDTGQYLGSPGAGEAKPEDSRMHDVYRSIQESAPLAVYVRAKLYRLRDGKEHWLDYARIFPILRRVQYNGFVCLVYEGWKDRDALHAVPDGVRFLRRYLQHSG